jgi:SAM-dependent methyltransferase
VLEALGARLADVGYLTERIEETLGGGRISFSPRDLVVHQRRLATDDPFAALVRLFLLGLPLEASAAAEALGPVDVGLLERAGWLQRDADGLRATVKLIPHGDLLIASDRDATDATATDWVAGIHPPSVTLGKLTVRQPVARALDVGTGNGVQALLASHHAESVVATDVNARACAFAALNARLNGVSNIELREGSYFQPVAGEEFDLVTCNPPYVISPESRYAYRDSGLSGDTVSRQVVEEAPLHLREGGFASLLVSWAHAPDDWWTPLQRWVEQHGCDALLLHFGSDDPVNHAATWLRPVAEVSTPRFTAAFE